MGVRVSKAGASQGKVRTFLHQLYCLIFVAGTWSQHVPLAPASPSLQGTFIDMKGARAAQGRGIDIYCEGHLSGNNFGFAIMLGGYGFGFAMLGFFYTTK